MRRQTSGRRSRGRGFLAATAAVLALALAIPVAGLGGFGPKGRETLRIGASNADEMAAYPGGKLLLFGPYAGRSFGQITRLRRSGAIDTSFGDNGQVAMPVSDLWVRRDGTILVVSTAARPDAPGETDAALTLLRPSGKPDRSFGDGGTVLVDLGRRLDTGKAVAVARDGRILVGGTSATREESRGGGDWVAVVARLRANGSPDRSFSEDGRAVLMTGGGVVDLASGPRGGVIAATSGGPGLALFRLDRGGAPDETFGEGGGVVADLAPGEDFFSPIEHIALLPGGRIVVAGTLSVIVDGGLRYSGIVGRYLPDGRLDPSFGGDGTVTAGFPAGWFFGSAFGARRDGRVVLGGETFVRDVNDADFAALCFGPRGALTRDFGRGGRARADFGGWDMVRSLALQPSGQVVMAGSTTESRHPKPVLRPTAVWSLPLAHHAVR